MIQSSPKAMEWIQDNHKHLWARSMFSTTCKCDYVTNNLAESFNAWIRHEKSLPVVELLDRIKQMIMEKLHLRRNISVKLKGKILPHLIKDLNCRSRGLPYKHTKGSRFTGEVSGVNKDLRAWRHAIDLNKRECTCKEWQLTGIPCTHAICLINEIRGEEVDDYVDNYYSVDKFRAAYVGMVQPMTDKNQWPKVDLGFKLWPPILKRSAGRPRERRLRGYEEGGTGKKRMKCKRCGQLGHVQKTCNETVDEPNAPPPAPPKPKRRRTKKNMEAEVPTELAQEVEDNKEAPSTPIKGDLVLSIELNNSPGALTRSRHKACYSLEALKLEIRCCPEALKLEIRCCPEALKLVIRCCLEALKPKKRRKRRPSKSREKKGRGRSSEYVAVINVFWL